MLLAIRLLLTPSAKKKNPRVSYWAQRQTGHPSLFGLMQLVADKALFLGWVFLRQRDSLRVMAAWAALFHLNPVVALPHGLIEDTVFVVCRKTLGFLADCAYNEHSKCGDNHNDR